MIRELQSPPRLGAEYWGRVHRAGDDAAPITLHQADRPFWAPEWELGDPHWRHRRPRALLALWTGLVLACLGAWAVILWAMGVL